MQPGGLRAGIGFEAGAEMGAGVEAGMGAGTNQAFTSHSLFQAQTSLLPTGLPLSGLCTFAYLLVALGVELGLGRELFVSSSSSPFSSLSVAPNS